MSMPDLDSGECEKLWIMVTVTTVEEEHDNTVTYILIHDNDT